MASRYFDAILTEATRQGLTAAQVAELTREQVIDLSGVDLRDDGRKPLFWRAERDRVSGRLAQIQADATAEARRSAIEAKLRESPSFSDIEIVYENGAPTVRDA